MKRIRAKYVHPMQMVLGLPITRDELRASLVVIVNEQSPAPIQAAAVRVAKARAA